MRCVQDILASSQTHTQLIFCCKPQTSGWAYFQGLSSDFFWSKTWNRAIDLIIKTKKKKKLGHGCTSAINNAQGWHLVCFAVALPSVKHRCSSCSWGSSGGLTQRRSVRTWAAWGEMRGNWSSQIWTCHFFMTSCAAEQLFTSSGVSDA